MKLSQVLEQKLIIDNWDVKSEMTALDEKLDMLKDNIANIFVSDLHVDLSIIDDDINATIQSMYLLVEHINDVRGSANKLMQSLSQTPLGESCDMYEETKDYINLETLEKYRAFDQFNDNSIAEEKFINLLRKFTSWKYPTVYIRPNSLRFFDALQASDILYVMEQCDINKWLNKNLPRSVFNMIKFKTINENKDKFLTQKLPIGQIGLIVMDHYMNFKPIGIIKQYLEESLELLRPGGHLIFTYNDCDLPAGARNFENGLYSYTPGGMVKLVAELAGFEVDNQEISSRVSWFVLKKPGELSTIKGGKTMGEILKRLD